MYFLQAAMSYLPLLACLLATVTVSVFLLLIFNFKKTSIEKYNLAGRPSVSNSPAPKGKHTVSQLVCMGLLIFIAIFILMVFLMGLLVPSLD